MRNLFIYLFVFTFFLISFLIIINKQETTNQVVSSKKDIREKRAVFFSYLEFNDYIKDKNEETSKTVIIEILDKLKINNFNMIILHVRPFSDSIYPSNIYPISDTVKVNGEYPNYDILKFIIEESKKRNIEIHAWINPYRISNQTNLSSVSKNSVMNNLIEQNCVKVVENKGIYYSPACIEVRNIIVEGIKELINNYQIDGIHFDDYFYPSDNIDLDNYMEYLEGGGTLSLKDYRYNNVLLLLKNVYENIKALNSDVLFGISPEGNIDNDYNNHYLDVKEILSKEGYIDYIMPQLYFGFNNSNRPFIKTLNQWDSLIKTNNIKLIPALAFYKTGRYDKFAGSGSNEWIENIDIISRQITEGRNTNNYAGFSLFRYDYLFNDDKQNENSREEFNNLKEKLG